jgi:hypothetical protein
MLCDSQESYGSLREVRNGRVCARKEEQKRRRIRLVNRFAAKMLLE